MKILLKAILFLFITVACKNQNGIQKTDSVFHNAELGIDSSANLEDSDDCIFDQLTQTDEFLREVPELSGYKWDKESRTATLKLSNGDTLYISRGGCDHFGVSAEFRLRNDTADIENWNNVYNKVLWIAKLLNSDFDYSLVKNDIDSNKLIFEKIEEIDVVYFSNEYLQSNNYSIERRKEGQLNIIRLSYYLN